MHLYLADWIPDPEEDGWISPYAGTLSGLDLSYGTAHLGIFATQDLQATGVLLGEHPDSIINRRDFETAFALGERLIAGTLGPAIWEILTFQADPLRVERPRCIMPTSRGEMNLWIGGQKFHTKRFSLTIPEWNPVQKNIQLDYRRIRQAVLAGKLPTDQHRRVLSKWMRKYGTDDHTVFIPSDLPDEAPLEPRTTVSDDFNRANENLEDSADWVLLNGTTGTASLVVFSNLCREDTTTPAQSYGQHQTALSSDDHFAEVDLITLTAPSSGRTIGGACVRIADDGAGKVDCYLYSATMDNGSAKKGRMQRKDSSANTTLVDEAETITPTVAISCEADGSDITGKIGGTITAGPTTDTTYTGQLNVGLVSRVANASVGAVELDNFSGGDLAASAGRIMSSLAGYGGLAGHGGMAGKGGGLAG